MARILIIDDERTFTKRSPEYSPYYQATYARNLLQAYHELFNNGPWDEVYLDHDLGERSDGSPAQVRDIAQDIERLAVVGGKLLDVGRFVIHSMNPLGREELYMALSRFYNVEFARVEDLL